MSVTIGWWAIPAAITIASVVWALWPQRTKGYGSDIVGAIGLMGAIILSLASWLIWSLLT